MKTIKEIDDVSGKRVLVRVDFNVPLEDGAVADDTRIRESLPTLEYLIERDARLLLCSHLGRPKGQVDEALRLDPVAERLTEMLGTSVGKVDDCIGEEVSEVARQMEPGDVVLLENTRFHPGEKANSSQFAGELAANADLFVNDAFAAAHRAHGSTVGVARHLPSVAGLLMEREVEALTRVRDNPEHPLVVIMGGAKITDKIEVIDRFLETADRLLVGGGIANTFLLAQGLEIGESLVDKESLTEAASMLQRGGDTIVLPPDAIIADEFSAEADQREASVEDVPDDWRILDIGSNSVARFREELQEARMVIWNGPMGAFEMSPFAEGTYAVARALADLEDVTTVIGGGETATAVHRAEIADAMTHVSTGGGAFLKFMEGSELPALAALNA